jgi:outer membrane receptor protein involved in Fe transport
VERIIIPSTWREMGAGLFGEIVPGLQYRMYAMNGLNAEEFESSGIREGRQGGSKALAENFAFTGRLDYSPDFAPGLLVGASAYLGDAGQDKLFLGKKIDVFTQLYEGHVQWHYRGLEFRALGAWGHIDDAATLSRAKGETIGSENYGFYTEAAYDVMPWLWRDSTQYLAPFFRYERYDTLSSVPTGFTNDGGFDRWVYQAGLTYKPIPNISIKADYRNVNSASGKPADELNLGVGFIY